MKITGLRTKPAKLCLTETICDGCMDWVDAASLRWMDGLAREVVGTAAVDAEEEGLSSTSELDSSEEEEESEESRTRCSRSVSRVGCAVVCKNI